MANYQLRLDEETQEKIGRLNVAEHDDLRKSDMRFLKDIIKDLWKPAA
jgi:hypothetical protein